MKKIADIAAYLFILAVIVLSTISIMGVWKFFSEEVIGKSFLTIGLLMVVAIIVLVADRFMGHQETSEGAGSQEIIPQPSPVFKSLRMATLSVLIVSASVLALLGIMAVWEVMARNILYRSIGSIAIVAFSSLIIVIICLEREKIRIFSKVRSRFSIVRIIVIILLIGFFLSFLSRIFYF